MPSYSCFYDVANKTYYLRINELDLDVDMGNDWDRGITVRECFISAFGEWLDKNLFYTG